MSAAIAVQHGVDTPVGLLGDWVRERGVDMEVVRADTATEWPELEDQPFIAVLGSEYSPNDTHVPYVARELEYVKAALARDIPVLGLCFGGQMLAKALGGVVEHAPEPELGWCTIESTDDDVPGGPWLQWHYERFHTPADAQRLAVNHAGDQAFVHGRSLGVQFHPESTIEIVSRWAELDRPRLDQLGIDDGRERLERGRHHAEPAAAAAFHLFDAFRRRASA